MKGFYVPAAFEVIRDPQRCVSCRLCIEQCPNGVHSFDEKRGVLLAEEDRCVDCQRCVAFCPTHALKRFGKTSFARIESDKSAIIMTGVFGA